MKNKTFEKSLMDFISENFAEPGSEWGIVKAGEDLQKLPINHLVQFIKGKRFYISLYEFIIKGQSSKDYSLSYTIRVTDEEPKVERGIITSGSLLIEVEWGNVKEGFCFRGSKCLISGRLTVAVKENLTFLTDIFSRLTHFNPAQ